MLAREICESLEKVERRDRSGRVVRIVDPDNGRSVPGRGVDHVEIGQEAVLLAQRKLEDIGAGEGGSPVGHRVTRFCRDDETPVAVAVDEHLREQEDRLLRPVGRDDFRVWIEVDAEAPPAPTCDGLPELGQPLGERIGGDLGEARSKRLANHRLCRLARIPLAEVDQRHSLSGKPPLGLFELHEWIRARSRQGRGELHGSHGGDSAQLAA